MWRDIASQVSVECDSQRSGVSHSLRLLAGIFQNRPFIQGSADFAIIRRKEKAATDVYTFENLFAACTICGLARSYGG